MSLIPELLDNELNGFRRNIERHPDRPSRRRKYRGIDPNHFAPDVEGRSSGVSQVYRRIDLNEIIIRTCADIASARRDDSCGDRAAKPKRVSDHKHPVADTRHFSSKSHIWKVRACAHLDECQIRLWIGTD